MEQLSDEPRDNASKNIQESGWGKASDTHPCDSVVLPLPAVMAAATASDPYALTEATQEAALAVSVFHFPLMPALAHVHAEKSLPSDNPTQHMDVRLCGNSSMTSSAHFPPTVPPR